MLNPSLRKAEEFVLGYLHEKHLRAEDLGVKPVVVLTNSDRFFRELISQTNCQRSPDWLYDEFAPLYFGSMPGIDFAFAKCLPPGAAFSMEMEVLRVLGGKIVIGVFEDIGVGTGTGKIYLVESALCTDGISYRYSGGRREVNASYRIHKFLANILEMEEIRFGISRAGSTDTPYYIVESDIQFLKQNGVELISLYISQMYACCFFSGIESCAISITTEDLLQKPKVSSEPLFSGIASTLGKHLGELAFI